MQLENRIELAISLATPTSRDRCFIQIDIIDSGTGFSESDLPHVFERLYRGDASRHRQQVTSDGSEALKEAVVAAWDSQSCSKLSRLIAAVSKPEIIQKQGEPGCKLNFLSAKCLTIISLLICYHYS
jgi:hypothetical protein